MKVMSDSMRIETFDFSGYQGTVLPAALWLPDDEPKAVLQITHGMTEHIGRYESFDPITEELENIFHDYFETSPWNNSDESDE